MTIGTPTLALVNSDSTDLTAYTTASVTLNSGSRYVLFVYSGISTGSVSVPSISTGHGTWSAIANATIPSGSLAVAAFEILGTGTTSTLTFTFASTQSNCAWRLIEITGADASRGSITASATPTPISATLSTSPLSTSVVLTAITYNAAAAQALTQGASQTVLGSRIDQSTPAMGTWAAYDPPAATAAQSWSSGNASGKALLVVEIPESTATNLNGSATITSTGSLSAAGVVGTVAAAALAATAALTGAGVVGANPTATLSGTGTITATAVVGKASTGSLAGTGALTGAATTGKASGSALTGTGALSASATVTAGGSSSATLAGTGSLSAAAVVGRAGTSTLAGTGALTAAGSIGLARTSALAGTATFTAAGTVSGGAPYTPAALERSATVRPEVRTTAVTAQDRRPSVAAEYRNTIVPAVDRQTTVRPEDRHPAA